jgi:hypothetical protein
MTNSAQLYGAAVPGATLRVVKSPGGTQTTTREQLIEAAECAYWQERFREMPDAEIYDVRVKRLRVSSCAGASLRPSFIYPR